MDKDMERLGSERLKRVKRRKRLAIFVVSMAVLVLSATIYRLIQPASAMDQDQTDFTVDGETLVYKNLSKLSSPPETIVDGNMPVEWNGEKFDFSVQMTFSINKDECKDANGNIINNYYMVYGDDIIIPDSLCDKWRQYTDDHGNDTCVYRFNKNEDGTFAILVKFNDGYLDSSTSTITGGANFSASGYGEINDDGDVIIKIGGDATLEVDKDYIEWNKDKSINYDISVNKSNTTDNTLKTDDNGKYAEYIIDVSSEKGTPDAVDITDILTSGRMSLDISKFTYTITRNGQPLGNEYSAVVEADAGNNNDNHNYKLTAVLPKLEAGDRCQITYKYYYDTSLCYNAANTCASNNVVAESTDKKTEEHVVDTSGSSINYTRDDLDKTGTYDKNNQTIKWTITVNKERNDIVGARLTDLMLGDAMNFSMTSEQDIWRKGANIEYDSNGKISAISFVGIDNNRNDSTYVITYETANPRKYKDYWIYNKVSFNKDIELSKDITITVPGTQWDTPITKELTGNEEQVSESRYKLSWQTSFTIPKGGVDKDSAFSDTLTSSVSDKQTHYMTYSQVKNVFDQAKAILGDHIGSFKVKSGDKEYDWNKISADTDMKFTKFSFKFNDDFVPANVGNEGLKVTFKYESYADYSAGGQITFKNTSKFCDGEAKSEFTSNKDIKSKITKTDGKDKTVDTKIKTTDSNYDGTLTWIVNVLMDRDSTKYIITDTMPQGVSVQSVELELKYNNTDGRYTYPSLDGKTYDVDNSSGRLWFTAGVRTSTNKVTDGDHEVITTTVEKPKDSKIAGWEEGSTIFLVYKCKADSAEAIKDGESLTYKNTASAKSDKNSNIGESSQTQIISKPKKAEETKPEHGDKVITKYGSWDDEQHKLNYTVIINPSEAQYLGAGKTLNLKDVLTYANKTYDDSIAKWKVDLIPGTVKFREAVRQDDGTFKAGDNVKGCTWTYSSNESPNEWESSTKTINAVIPDGKAIMLTYTYVVKADIISTWGDSRPRFNVSNTVSLEGVEKGKTDSKVEVKYTRVDSSFFVYKNNTYVLFKTKEGDYSTVLPGAEFQLYQYNPESTEADKTSDGYVAVGKYVTNDSGKIQISFDKTTMTYNTQYFIIETKAPEGYLLPDEVERNYFYFASPDTTKYPVCAPGELVGTSLANSYCTQYVEDPPIPTTSISVNKVWQNSTGNKVIKKDGRIFIRLHQIDQNGQDKTYGDDVEITPDSDGNWSYTFKNLPKNPVDENGKLIKAYNYKYYVEEVGINNKNDFSGYTTSYIYIDQNGVASGDVTSGNISKVAIEAGSVEITNKENAYALPETGGSGNRWLYMLSGFVLVLIAGISLFYKHNKPKI